MIKIGSHVSLKGIDMLVGSVKEALEYDSNCFMIYLGAPQNTYRKDIKDFKIKEALEIINKNNILVEDIIIHAPYIVNLATSDKSKYEFYQNFISEEIKKTDYIGAKYIVFHPGSNPKEEEGIKNIIFNLNNIFEKTKDNKAFLLIETMAGKGNELGRNFDQISKIISGIKNKSRIGVCLDTCHIHDSGMDLSNFDLILDDFDSKIGLDYLKVIHINDSKNIVGSRKDRHENFGYGEIGFDKLINVIYNKRVMNLVKILETPYFNDKAPYKYEIKMIKEKVFYNFKENLNL